MPTDSSLSLSNRLSKSAARNNDNVKIESQNSNVNVTQGDNNTINQYHGVQPSKIPPEKIHYNVQNPVQSFTGRGDILRALHKAITQNRQNGDLTILTNVVTGLGGVGKTETVRRYIQLYKDEYSHVLWINAEKRSQVTDCLISIARLSIIISVESAYGKLKKSEDIAAEVYNFICKKPSFIVFDNANSLLDEDGEDGIGTLIPLALQTGSINPDIVMTSRNRKWTDGKIILLSSFADKESYNLLRKQLQFEETEENRSWAAQISHLCDGLPLVIQQVIEVIKMETDKRETVGKVAYSMLDFLNDYHEGNKRYVDKKPYDVPADLGASYTVYNIFKLTFIKIEKTTDGGLSLECLNILALLNPDGVPVNLLLSFFDNEIQDRVIDALTLLRKYNLLNVAEKSYRMHRMLQKVRIEMLKNGNNNLLREVIIQSSNSFCKYLDSMASNDTNKFLILENGIRLANLIFTEKCGNHTKKFLSKLGDTFINNGKYYNAIYIFKNLIASEVVGIEVRKIHEKLAYAYKLDGKYTESERTYIELLAGNISKMQEEVCESEAKLRLIYGLAEVYVHQGKYGQAKCLLKYVKTHQTKILNPEHKDILETKNTLAGVFKILRKYTAAEELLTEVLKSRIVLGQQDPNTLTTKHNLALVFESQGKYTEAEELYIEVLNSRIEILGPEHPNTLTTKHNLALLFESLGNYTDAEKLYREVLKSEEVVLGPEHPSILTTKHNLALVFKGQGKYTEAEELYSTVLNSRMVLLGPDHPDTLATKHNLALVFESQGKYKEAEKYYTKAFKPQIVIVGPVHPNILTTRHNLAFVFESQGKYAEAEELYTEVLESRTFVLGPEHPDTLATKNNLAAVLNSQGKYRNSEEIYTEVLELRMLILGPEHPDTLATKNNLAAVFKSQRKYTDAQELYIEVLKFRKDLLGLEHPNTLATKNNLAAVFKSQGIYTKAEELYVEVLKSRMFVLGPDHPDTLVTKNNLAAVFNSQGRYTEAEERYIEVLKSRMVILGLEHPDTLATKNNLAAVFKFQGKFKDAEELF